MAFLDALVKNIFFKLSALKGKEKNKKTKTKVPRPKQHCRIQTMEAKTEANFINTGVCSTQR